MLKITVSGSFNRHLDSIANAMADFSSKGVQVLSPRDTKIVACDGQFLFVAGDKSRDVRLVQDMHMDAIRDSDFLWVIAPDGYIGRSVSMEIGYAVCYGVPVLSSSSIVDRTLLEYVRMMPSLEAAVAEFTRERVMPPHISMAETHRAKQETLN